MINYDNNKDGFVKLKFRSSWDYIPITREFVSNFLSVKVLDKYLISNATIVAEELLENAIRNSSYNGVDFQILKDDKKNEVIIKIKNYSDTEKVEELLSCIKEIDTTDNKLELYIDKLKKSTKSREKKSGIGLARIAYENNASIYATYQKIDHKMSLVEVVSSIKCN